MDVKSNIVGRLRARDRDRVCPNQRLHAVRAVPHRPRVVSVRGARGELAVDIPIGSAKSAHRGDLHGQRK